MDKRDTVLAKLAMALGLLDAAAFQQAMGMVPRFPGRTFDRVLLEGGLIDNQGWKRLVDAFNEQVRAAKAGPGATPAAPVARPPTPQQPLAQPVKPRTPPASERGQVPIAGRRVALPGAAQPPPQAAPPPPVWPPPGVAGQPPPAWPPPTWPPPGAHPWMPPPGWTPPPGWIPPPGWVPPGVVVPVHSDEADLSLPPDDESDGGLILPVDEDPGLGSTDDLIDPVDGHSRAGSSPLALPDSDEDAVFAEQTMIVRADDAVARDETPTAVDESVFAEPTMIIPAGDEPPTRSGGRPSSGRARAQEEATAASSSSGEDSGVFAEPTIVLTDGDAAKKGATAPADDAVFGESTVVITEGAGSGSTPIDRAATGGLQFDMSLASSGRRKAAQGGEPGELTRDEFQRRLKAKQDFKGFILGDYKILSELARGAFGVVLEVETGGSAKTVAHQRGIKGNLALKIMLENSSDPREKERFLDEVRVLIGLDHPHIVKIFDAGGTNDGLRFLAMELVKGTETRTHVKKTGPMPPLLAVRVVKEIASALSYVHAQKIYHRDLKPQNVMLDMACQPYRALLIDFGLVSEQQSADKDKGLIMGTPNYMPPEQAAPKGGFGDVDHSSDLYSLGATFYYLLTGEPPFAGLDPKKIIQQVVKDRPKDPAERNKNVSRRIADICLKCLEKRQEDRYPSSRALEGELDKELRTGQRMLKAKSIIGKFLGRPRDDKKS